MSKPPELKISLTPGKPPRFNFEGWRELDRWANHNCPTWRRVHHQTEVAGVTNEEDRLRLLAATLLIENEALRQANMKEMFKAPLRFILPGTPKEPVAPDEN